MTSPLLRPGLTPRPDEFSPELDAASLPVTTLSPSSISTLLACPEQWRMKYVLRLPDPGGPWSLSGSAFHDVIETAVQKARAREAFTVADAEAAWDQAWSRQVVQHGGSVKWTWKWSQETMESTGRAIALAYAKAVEAGRIVVAPDTRTEEWVEAYLPGIPLRVVGRLDTVSPTVGVRDTKTTTRGTKKPKPEWLIQGLVYMAVTGLDVEWHVISATARGPVLWLPDEYPDLRLSARPSRILAGEGYVRAAYDSLVHYVRTYGLQNPWPGVGVVSDSCFFCVGRTRCPWTPS